MRAIPDDPRLSRIRPNLEARPELWRRQFTNPQWEKQTLGEQVKYANSHFKAFKRKHRHGMAVTRIDKSVLTASNANGHGSWLDSPLWRERMRKAYLMIIKSAGKFSVREGVAYVILAAALAFGFQSWWRGQDQHDEIIRLQARLEAQSEKNGEMGDQIAEARATAQIADKNAARLEGKFDQFSLQYTIANPRKSAAPAQ